MGRCSAGDSLDGGVRELEVFRRHESGFDVSLTSLLGFTLDDRKHFGRDVRRDHAIDVACKRVGRVPGAGTHVDHRSSPRAD